MEIMQDSESAVCPPNPKQRFVLGGIKAAQSSYVKSKLEILSDVADVMDCPVTELSFLTTDNPVESAGILTFPDAKRPNVEIPNDYLEAAE